MEHVPRQSGKKDNKERRGKRRFPIQLDLRYRLLHGSDIAETGKGHTVDMSSSGVRFTVESSSLAAGMPVELSITWPALLNGMCPMNLFVYGCVVRAGEDHAAVAIDRYEFRTQGAQAIQVPTALVGKAHRTAV